MSKGELFISAVTVFVAGFGLCGVIQAYLMILYQRTMENFMRLMSIQKTGHDLNVPSGAKHVSLAEKQKKAMDAQRER